MQENRIDLGGTWRRSFGGKVLDCVPVPGSYPPVGECILEFGFDCSWGNEKDDQRSFLCTEGVLSTAEFTLNNQTLGKAGPLAPYRLELPRGLLKKHNIIQAKIRDILEKFGPAKGRRFDGGLARALYIERRASCFIENVAWRPVLSPDFCSAQCSVTLELNGKADSKVEYELVERDTGRIVAKSSANAGEPMIFSVDRPRLWSPDSPTLYTLTVRLTGKAPDKFRDIVGFRKIEIRGQDFFLNDKRLILKGVCRHEFNELHGYSPTYAEVRNEMTVIKRAGFNYIRLVHSPHGPEACRLAAELGIVVSEEPGPCFHDLSDEAIIGPALETLRRLILRDRNVPSILAWYIYNECNPDIPYAKRAAKICRELDPGCLISFADCSRQNDNIKAMLKEAALSFYGINIYDYWPEPYIECFKIFTDRPIVMTEWGGFFGQGNARALKNLCAMFAKHVQEHHPVRLAGCAFWIWADYEERSRGGLAAPEGYTIEGLTDRFGQPKDDLATLSAMCREMDNPEPRFPAPIEILLKSRPHDGRWQTVALEAVPGDQSLLENEIAEMRKPYRDRMPHFGRLFVDGIEFACRNTAPESQALLLGKGREKIEIAFDHKARGIAILGQVALKGGFPAFAGWKTHYGPMLPSKDMGTPASEYAFLFEDDTSEIQPLLHGVHILRGNNICASWSIAPRGPETTPAVQVVLSPVYEILRFDLWKKEFAKGRRLKAIRWILKDPDTIQALMAISIME